MSVPDNLTVCIIGGGNGAITMAADLTLRGFAVRLWDFPAYRDKSIEAIGRRGGIELVGARQGFASLRPEQLPLDIAQAIDGASLVMLIVPAYGHATAARVCAPHLRPGQYVVVGPSTGGALEVWNELRKAGVKQVPVAEMLSLIYTCRLRDETTADLYYVKDYMPIGVQPSENTASVVERLSLLYPQVVGAKNVMETSVNNVNPVLHIAPMLLNLGRIETTEGDFLFYRESVTNSVGRLMDKMDAERVALAELLGFQRFSLADFMREMYQVEGANAEELLASSPAHRSTRAPFGIGHRYLTEDVPYGLVPMLSIARLVGHEMPLTRLFVNLASALADTDWSTAGRSAEQLGLADLSPEDLSAFLQYGRSDAHHQQA